ncbi:MAG: hypothetical protein ACYTG1_11780 [Planctomycetota bacterium]
MRAVAGIILGLVTWAWTLWTLALVGRFGGAVLLDPGTTSRIMATGTGTRLHSAFGLTYHGVEGAVVVVAELLVVGAALLASLGQSVRVRRPALVILVAWAGLWLANSIWMEQLSGGRHPTDTTLVGLAAIAVLGWTVLRWRSEPAAGAS